MNSESNYLGAPERFPTRSRQHKHTARNVMILLGILFFVMVVLL